MPNTTAVRSYTKEVSLAPRKVALVASLVRGRSVADALAILAYTPKRAAKPLMKSIESAKANAINDCNLEAKSLVISKLSVTAGSRLKRYKPSIRGRALPFQKKTSNILVELIGDQRPKKSTPVVDAPKQLADSKSTTETKVTVKKEKK
jgi:large subunit ribosomal protein L22